MISTSTPTHTHTYIHTHVDDHHTATASKMTMARNDTCMVFEALHDDPISELRRQFMVTFYPTDHTVELHDCGSTIHKKFLKRSPCETLRTEQFYIGSTVTIWGRLFQLTGYADSVTAQLCEQTSETTILMIGASLFPRVGELLEVVTVEMGFGVRAMRTIDLPENLPVTVPVGCCSPAPHEKGGLRRMALLLLLIHEDAVRHGATIPQRFSATRGDIWAAHDADEVARAQGLFDLAAKQRCVSTCTGGTSVVVIKPHVMEQRRGGEVVRMVLRHGLQLVALAQLSLSPSMASQFLQPYKGVLKGFQGVVNHLSSGPIWALQVTLGPSVATADDASDLTAVAVVRSIVGPHDSTIAKVLCPDTIRAVVGVDSVKNAVHCSDIDGHDVDEANFLFAL